ncbi:MAG TPA: DUF1080 domain-containing protein [Burkholderiales bacterium]|nr:DUF1080 domain-containing protein [Burkholderiales bacterium]
MFEALPRDAWRAYRDQDFPTRSWTAEADVIRALAEGPRVHLISRKRYGDFELHFDWCVAEGGNSGVLYRVSEDYEEPWHSGLEMQLLDDPRHPDGMNPTTACGALYDLLPSSLMEPVPPSMFVTACIVVRGTAVEHWLANQLVLSYDLSDPTFRRHVAQSKFKDYPAFGTVPEGHIVLQHHGTGAAFRNLRIRELD